MGKAAPKEDRVDGLRASVMTLSTDDSSDGSVSQISGGVHVTHTTVGFLNDVSINSLHSGAGRLTEGLSRISPGSPSGSGWF